MEPHGASPESLQMNPLVVAPLALLAAVAGVAWPSPGRAEIVSSAPGSGYATARQTCTRQGQALQLYSDQTNDKDIARGVTVKYRCVATARTGAARPAKRPRRGARRTASAPRR